MSSIRRNPVPLFAILGFGLALPMAGSATAQEAREITIPVGSRWLVNVTFATVNALVNQGFRVHDLEIASASPFLLDAVLVRDTGPYARTTWTYTGMTPSDLQTQLTANTARLIDLEPYYNSGGQLKFAAVMVENGRGNYKDSWHLTAASASTISSHLVQDNARIIDLDTYLVGTTRYYSVVTIRNTGSDARVWWWSMGQTAAQLQAQLQQNQAQLIDLERIGRDQYAAVMVQPPAPTDKWHYTGITEAEILLRVSQHGARVVDLEQSGTGLSARYDVVLIENTDGFVPFGTGCAGTNGVPLHFGSGTPALGENIAFGVGNGPTSQWGVVYFGVSNTVWSSFILPFDLGVFGAPGCMLQNDPTVPVPIFSNANGAGRTLPMTIPVLQNLIGASIYSHVWLPDPGANAIDLITTGGVRTRIRA